jgi:predicted nucleic acid-binding protein
MDEELKTRNVFLDTEVFVAENFYVGTNKLAELSKLAAEGKINLLMSKVTVDECKKRIHKMVAEAREAVNKAETKRTLGILRNSTSLGTSCLGKWDNSPLCFTVSVRKAKLIIQKISYCSEALLPIYKPDRSVYSAGKCVWRFFQMDIKEWDLITAQKRIN